MGIREHANLVDVTFTTMRDSRLAADVGQLMAAFYREESPASSFDRALFSQTIGFYLANPQRGCLVLFMDGGLLVGYALVTAIWSNEFGGMLLFVDELFVVPAARKRGIARAFFDYLKARPLFDPVALGLGVRPANGGARRLYESVGFAAVENITYVLRLPAQPPAEIRRGLESW